MSELLIQAEALPSRSCSSGHTASFPPTTTCVTRCCSIGFGGAALTDAHLRRAGALVVGDHQRAPYLLDQQYDAWSV